jgi:hypothetical protein
MTTMIHDTFSENDELPRSSWLAAGVVGVASHPRR